MLLVLSFLRKTMNQFGVSLLCCESDRTLRLLSQWVGNPSPWRVRVAMSGRMLLWGTADAETDPNQAGVSPLQVGFKCLPNLEYHSNHRHDLNVQLVCSSNVLMFLFFLAWFNLNHLNPFSVTPQKGNNQKTKLYCYFQNMEHGAHAGVGDFYRFLHSFAVHGMLFMVDETRCFPSTKQKSTKGSDHFWSFGPWTFNNASSARHTALGWWNCQPSLVISSKEANSTCATAAAGDDDLQPAAPDTEAKWICGWIAWGLFCFRRWSWEVKLDGWVFFFSGGMVFWELQRSCRSVFFGEGWGSGCFKGLVFGVIVLFWWGVG